ncbi:MAG: acyl carrier protein [Subdoligranulum sp.]|nr:acyl carrier protein [Subdoligranulum sp.]
MEQLLELLEEIRPDVDFKTETNLIDDGILDSFDVISTIQEINDAFDIEIQPTDIVPQNFNSVSAMWQMIQRLMEE